MMEASLPSGTPPAPTIVWRDDRNAAGHAELLNFARRATDRQVDRMLRIMPVFPDAPELVVPSGDLWVPERRIAFANERELAEEIRRCGGLGDFKSQSADEHQTEKRLPCAECAVCGPNVTAQVIEAIKKTKAQFAKWDRPTQQSHCDILFSVWPSSSPDAQPDRRHPEDGLIAAPEGYGAWDVLELHHQEWIMRYLPACATSMRCITSVQIEGQCHYAGSVNYVIFGLMCRLCKISGDKMQRYISLYKGGTGIKSKADNYKPSLDWAYAGLMGWGDPESAEEASFVHAPAGDRPQCKPTCALAYGPRPTMRGSTVLVDGQPFVVFWKPDGIK
jgi:hypothetical protein